MANTKYLVTPIVPADGGFGEYDCSPYTFRSNAIDHAAARLTDDATTRYIELPDEGLAEEGADITGKIHDEPERVFAIPTEYPGEYIYFGLSRV